MKSSSFAYERPTDVQQALASKSRWGLSAKYFFKSKLFIYFII